MLDCFLLGTSPCGLTAIWGIKHAKAPVSSIDDSTLNSTPSKSPGGPARATQSVNTMSHEDIPILVVDDAKFSSAIIAKALRGGGFSNVRFTNNPLQALRSLEKRPAQILIADSLRGST